MVRLFKTILSTVFAVGWLVVLICSPLHAQSVRDLARKAFPSVVLLVMAGGRVIIPKNAFGWPCGFAFCKGGAYLLSLASCLISNNLATERAKRGSCLLSNF